MKFFRSVKRKVQFSSSMMVLTPAMKEFTLVDTLDRPDTLEISSSPKAVIFVLMSFTAEESSL